ncbi:hypothetical protein Plec18167_003328 [Paecilomyces lecythidis]|uniref:Uncharacterized protein n=1 Tax=Paecilomyces lecythidis TaxID=3004212 RepID=A0ABR3Y145_9EURO
MCDEKELPRTKKAWSKEVAAADIQGLTIHNFPLRSASKMELAQYLLLRVLWREHNAGDLDTHRYGLSDFLEPAKEKLQHYNGWKEYYKHVHLPDQETIPDLMTFSTPRFYQLLIKRSIKDDVKSSTGNEDVIFSPIQTRGQRRQAERAASPTERTTRQMKTMQLETPTKSGPSDTDTDLFGEVSSAETESSIGISPYQEKQKERYTLQRKTNK